MLSAMTGDVRECWRYPVKSMQGIPVGELTVGRGGVVGDRTLALIDNATGHILSAKSVKELLHARIDGDKIVLPDSTVVSLHDPEASATLAAWLGRDVRLATPVEGEERSFSMTFDPPNDDADYVDIPAPAGTFLDLAHVHLVTTATLEGCRAERPDLDWDVRRFRPNLVIGLDAPPFVENDWTGRRLRVGPDVELEIIGPTVRCAMPLRAQPGLERQPQMFRAMSDLNTQLPNHVGAYATVRTTGVVSPGNTVELVDA